MHVHLYSTRLARSARPFPTPQPAPCNPVYRSPHTIGPPPHPLRTREYIQATPLGRCLHYCRRQKSKCLTPEPKTSPIARRLRRCCEPTSSSKPPPPPSWRSIRSVVGHTVMGVVRDAWLNGIGQTGDSGERGQRWGTTLTRWFPRHPPLFIT